MKLYLVQHGEAVAKEIDPDRPLSEVGAGDIRQLAAWLGGRGVQLSRVVHSGKTRAMQTAERLAAAVAPQRPVEEMQGLDPKDPVAPLAVQIGEWTEDALLVGHQPFMGRLVSALVKCEDRSVVAFQPGTLVCLESDGAKDWLLACVLRPESYRTQENADSR